MKLIFSNSHFNAIILHSSKLDLQGYRVISWTQGKAQKNMGMAYDILFPDISVIYLSKFKTIMLVLGCIANSVIIGDYRSRSAQVLTAIRSFLRRLGLPLKTYFVDDGSNSLHLKSLSSQSSYPSVDAFYSCFDIGHKNTISVDPSRTLLSINATNLTASVLFLGTAEVASGYLSQDEYLDAILKLKKIYPEIVYKPHRKEKAEFIEILKSNYLTLLDVDIPLEFFDLSQVNKIYTTGTSSQIWLNRLYKDLDFERLEFGDEWNLNLGRKNAFDELWNATK